MWEQDNDIGKECDQHGGVQEEIWVIVEREHDCWVSSEFEGFTLVGNKKVSVLITAEFQGGQVRKWEVNKQNMKKYNSPAVDTAMQQEQQQRWHVK